MTDEDKKIVADYMKWIFSEYGGDYYYIPKNGKVIYFDIYDASLVVAEMQKRGEWDYCWDYLFDTYDELCINENLCYRSSDFTAWLFNPDNFFNAFVAWRKRNDLATIPN